jgi:5-methylcytosine-specific restriction endonuclease McrA
MTSSKYFESSLSRFKYPAPIPDTNDVIYISHSQLHDTEVSRIYANHVQSVTFPGHVQFEDTLSKTLYNKGKLYNVIFIEDDHFIIEGHISCKNNQHFVWKNAIFIEPKVDYKTESKVEAKVYYKSETKEPIAYIKPIIAEPIEKKNSKKQIPKAVKSHIWDHYIGRHINEHRCLCCKKAYIRNTDFVTGHVISEANGGTLEINNLRPICAVCNNGMGQMNMVDYVKTYGYYI